MKRFYIAILMAGALSACGLSATDTEPYVESPIIVGPEDGVAAKTKVKTCEDGGIGGTGCPAID